MTTLWTSNVKDYKGSAFAYQLIHKIKDFAFSRQEKDPATAGTVTRSKGKTFQPHYTKGLVKMQEVD